MNKFTARSPSRKLLVAAPDYRSLSPVLLPKPKFIISETRPDSQTVADAVTRQESSLGEAQKYKLEIQKSIEGHVVDGKAAKELKRRSTGDSEVFENVLGTTQVHQATKSNAGDDIIRLNLIKGAQRLEGGVKPKPRPVGVLYEQDSLAGIYDHLGPDSAKHSGTNGEQRNIKFRPGIGGIDMEGCRGSSAPLTHWSDTSTVEAKDAGEGEVKQVAMVPLRNKKQAQVTYTTTKDTAKGVDEPDARMSMASILDYEVKLEDAGTMDSPEVKRSESNCCYGCCAALKLNCRRKKHTANDKENIILDKERDMYRRFVRAKRVVGLTLSICYLITGIIVALIILIALIVVLAS